jgi:hypothetical protein
VAAQAAAPAGVGQRPVGNRPGGRADCGSPLACFEHERYCLDCTRYEVEELARQADDETRLLRQMEALAARPDEGPAGDGLPF